MLLTKAETNIYFHLVRQLVQVCPPVFHMHYLLTMDYDGCYYLFYLLWHFSF